MGYFGQMVDHSHREASNPASRPASSKVMIALFDNADQYVETSMMIALSEKVVQ